ncbi:hypothetical protein Cob_v007525 [Colletotrichum orbiculare MAFF 240422]|uniref:Uncharacterized protein n=1 Tax=Colletotrichum orbiculare (strain 104-T / ATCC 96160 / CBS 514.97 / LARS 414 / MAFF 240422) TaxID=1213857 RepID=A0A484FP21_COLOR|nr:hypothetical protein Cob_v007525 [Colletotrichum orbiculare MAFF 240422]
MAPTIHRGKHGGVDLCDSCLPIVFDDSGKDFHESLSEDEAKPTLRHIKEDTGEMIMLQGFRLRQDSLPNLAGLLESSLSGCRLCGFIRLHILERDIGYEGEVYMNAGYTWGVDRDIFGSSTTNEGLVFWRCEVYKAPDSASVASISFNIESDDDKIVNWLRTDSKRAPQLLNEENVDWITSELRRCRNECGHIKDDTGFLPTRLIDVGDSDVDEPRLVISETLQRRFADDCPKLEYATLSYCWGPKEDAEQQVKTTRESLGMHLSRLPLASMSPVVRDTVRVCRALRIKYLWVDALCIVQGDAEDWNRESLTMGRVYYCATLTICPLASTSCLQGYLEPRSQGLTVEFQSSKRKDVNGTYTLFRSSDDRQAFWNQSSLLIDLSSSLWETRGWTFQENFLSGRTLFVGPSMWHFACENGGISENGYLYHGSVVHGSLRPLVDMARQPLPEDPDEASRTIRNAYARWDEIMQIQRRSWSYREDLLPGIAGLAEECAMITGDAYLAGLWKMDLHHELVWEVIKPEAGTLESAVRQKLDPRPYVAPSWSWASQTRPFELLPTRRYFPDAPRLPEEHEAKKTQKLVSLVDSMPCHPRRFRMQLSTPIFVAAISLGASAWEITIYNNVLNCDANGDTIYRVLTGTSQNCYTFDRDMPGVGCRQYNSGGANNGGCTSASLIPRSAFIKPDGPARCQFFYEENCTGGNSISITAPNWQNSYQNLIY